MIITKEDLKQKTIDKNISWLEDSRVERRIKKIISSKDILPENVIEFLWQKRIYRYDLAKSQILPEHLIKYVILNSKKKIEVSSSLYAQTLKKQILTKDLIEFIYQKSTFSDMLNVWSIIPTKVNEYISNRLVFECNELEMYNMSSFISTVITMCSSSNSILDDFISFLEEDLDRTEIIFSFSQFLSSFSCSIAFRDESLDRLIKIINPETFKLMAKFIISRNKCSKSFRTILILLY